MEQKRLIKCALVGSIAALGLVALLTGLQSIARALMDPYIALSGPTPSSSFLFRFDPASGTFYTLPLQNGSLPYDVAVTGTMPTHVWVTEFGTNKIGHLVYTGTNDAAWSEYPVSSTVNSGPYRLTLDGNFVWFTERGANRVGRLDATTGEMVEFYGNGLSANSGLADIKVAPNGWIWVAGQASNRLVRLAVTPADFAFSEYTHTLLVGPSALAIEPGGDISSYNLWFTAPDATWKVGRLAPATSEFVFVFGFPPDSRPYDVVTTGYIAWLTDWGHNSVDQFEIGTTPIPILYGSVSRPAGLALASSNVFWMTLQNEQGGLARFVYTSTSQTHFDSYSLPTLDLLPTGPAVARDGGIWLGAFAPWRVFLPTVLKS